MFWQIVLHTPLWVWPLFLGLLALGFSQSRDRTVPGSMVLALPAIMVAYSAYGVIATFGMDPRALTA